MRIRKRSDRDSWLLDCGLLHGRRVQLTYKSRAEAEAEKKRREKLLRDEGKAAFQLSSAEQAACLRAIEQLREVGASLSGGRASATTVRSSGPMTCCGIRTRRITWPTTGMRRGSSC